MPEVRLGDLLVSLYDLLGWGLSEIGLHPSAVSIAEVGRCIYFDKLLFAYSTSYNLVRT